MRGNRKITLTDEGMMLRKRAEEITELVKKTEDEIMLSDDAVTGNVYIGAGETDAVRLLARTACQLQKEFPQICIYISSGDSNLCFRPLYPRLEVGLNVVWKKYQILNKASEKFLERLYELI